MSYPKIHQVERQIKKDLGPEATAAEINDEYEKRKAAHEIEETAVILKQAYTDDIFDEMFKVFGTYNTDNANADYETYKVMAENPEIFAQEGLLDTDGESLDTPEKVSDFASLRISEIEAYSVFRLKRIKKYKEDLKQLTGE